MSVISDPHIDAVHTRPPSDWHQFEHDDLIAAPERTRARIASGRRRWFAVGGLVLSLSVLYAASRMLFVLAAPLSTASAVRAPAWLIELNSNGDRPATALVFGDEVGVQLVRVPPIAEGKDAARLIPARLLKGDVHIVSLGLSSLLVEASAPKGAPKMSWGA